MLLKPYLPSIVFLLSSLCANTFFSLPAPAQTPMNRKATVTVFLNPDHPANRFIPSQALGAGIDGHERGDINKMLSPANVKQMLTAGFKPLTYRLRTELGCEAWHWNPQGKWSDAAHRQGYWTSDAKADRPISVCYGYRLPRRGNTHDQANNDDYSRLDDGDTGTFWKSNPYLDWHFTGEDNAEHPQWVLVDLGEAEPVNAIRLLWGVPYATQYAIDYAAAETAEAESAYLAATPTGIWRRFPNGEVRDGKGGTTVLYLSDKPIKTRYVRIWMTAASATAPAGSKDIRDRLGYALREVYVGSIDEAGSFHDSVSHAKNNEQQSPITVSSTDPWHRAVDIDYHTEQAGFDRIFKCGLTNNMPMLTPVPLLYDTPENAVAEILFLKSRGYKFERLEMGEEPEGQFIPPEDYGALYLEWADAIHNVDARLQLGGPCLAAIDSDLDDSTDERDTKFWMEHFLRYLRDKKRLNDFRFFSFEWYPFDDVCKPTAPQLARAPRMLENALKKMRQAGLPENLPLLMTEYGYSAFAAQAEVDIEGALLNAEIAAQFLTLGGERAYLFGYESNDVIQEVPCTWGINAMFLRGASGRIAHTTATYHGARLLTQEWAQPGNLPHEIYPAQADCKNEHGQSLITAYAVHRPDHQWAVMLINKDPKQAYRVRVQIKNQTSNEMTELHPDVLYQFSSEQYVWHAAGDAGYPSRSLPPKEMRLAGRADQEILLPPYSLSVVRGH